MILAQPRSKSTLMAECFSNNHGEIFSIVQFYKESSLNGHQKNASTLREIWQTDLGKDYLKHLEKKLTETENITFKVFMHHVIDVPEVLNLIKKINPRIFYIYRKNGIHAVKSLLIAEKRGFVKDEHRNFMPFTVDFKSFYDSYSTCIIKTKMAHVYFKMDWTTTYEDFNPHTFPYAEKVPLLEAQKSEEFFTSILNETQVDDWFNTLQSKNKTEGTDLIKRLVFPGDTNVFNDY